MPRVIAVSGGKGGTGKSFVATNLATYLASLGKSVVLADVDVEAPNDHILLGVKELMNEEPIKTFLPIIDYSKCTACGACVKACDTGALIGARGRPPIVMPRLCSGCMACYYVCPFRAISPDGRRVIGYTYHTPVRKGEASLDLVTGVLREGEEHTPPAVIAARDRAERVARGKDALIIDTGAGTGNSVSVAVRGAELLIAVTEPTPLGVHDLAAILELAGAMGLRTWVVVNRWGIGAGEGLDEVIREAGVERVVRVPYSRGAVEAYVAGEPVILRHRDDPAARALLELGEEVASFMGWS